MSSSEATSNNKEIRILLKLARSQGWRIDGQGKHLRWFAPDGIGIVVTSATPSDHRALHNIKRDLRRAGLKF